MEPFDSDVGLQYLSNYYPFPWYYVQQSLFHYLNTIITTAKISQLWYYDFLYLMEIIIIIIVLISIYPCSLGSHGIC